jgi:tRNA(Ile)-lysidine synthase
MASSRKSSRSRSAPADLAARVAAQLGKIVRRSTRLVVGLSGGIDSVVLLDCLQRAARKRRLRISALHIDHRINPNSASWAKFCRRLCRERGIPFECAKVDVVRGDSLEAAARAARYAVYSRQQCDYVVLAHHRDDQVETFLLQLLRGAGVKGLAGMPLARMADGGWRMAKERPSVASRQSPIIVRPLLDVTRAEIAEYAKRYGLKWIEDESNSDIHFRRNFLRHEVLPVVERRFPGYRATVARAARHLAEAAGVLDEVAAADAAGQIADGSLAVQALRRLPRARARNLLRYFLDRRGVSMPGAERLEEALRQVLGAKGDAKVAIGLKEAELRRFAGRIYVVHAIDVPAGFHRRWRGERRMDLPELGGTLEFERGAGRGIGAARLRGAAITVRLRQGGERLQPDCRRPRRSLKNLLQEAGVAPWLRERLPLIYHGEDLVGVPGVGVECAYQARREEAAFRPAWLPTG